jgi:hypothetical protein
MVERASIQLTDIGKIRQVGARERHVALAVVQRGDDVDFPNAPIDFDVHLGYRLLQRALQRRPDPRHVGGVHQELQGAPRFAHLLGLAR